MRDIKKYAYLESSYEEIKKMLSGLYKKLKHG